jgi:hypothetical protein
MDEHYSNNVAKITGQKLKNSCRLIKMTEQTKKMTESRGVVGVQGRSARSGPRQLDQSASSTRGRGVNAGVRVNTGCMWLHPTWASMGIGRARPLARWVTDWLVQVMDQWVHHPRAYIYTHTYIDTIHHPT